MTPAVVQRIQRTVDAHPDTRLGREARAIWRYLDDGMSSERGAVAAHELLPDRDDGAPVATSVLLVATIGYDVYVTRFAGYNTTYRASAGHIILVRSIRLAASAVLYGAELTSCSKSAPRNADDPDRGPSAGGGVFERLPVPAGTSASDPGPRRPDYGRGVRLPSAIGAATCWPP